MSLFSIENLIFGYEDRTLLKKISIRLLPREHAALVGANGTGKTTLMNLLTGRQLPDEGSIIWSGSAKPGYLDQSVDIPPDWSIRDVLTDAFAPLFRLENDIAGLASSLQQNPEQPDLLRRMGTLQEELDAGDFHRVGSLVDNTANGLGLTAVGMDKKACMLSGGQRAKVLIGRLLLQKPDVLLLDEPTNHLDTPHIDWLAGHLTSYPGSFLVISHDPVFLDRIANSIWHLEFAAITKYPGNYSKFVALSAARREGRLQAFDRQQEEIARMEDFIRRNIVRASTTGRAQSRQKTLDRMDKIEKPKNLPRPRFSFKACTESERIVLETNGLVIGYDTALLPQLDITIEQGEKIAVSGMNGIGKTTLVRTLLGQIEPLEGNAVMGKKVIPLYYEQESRSGREFTALDFLWRQFPGMERRAIHSALARCGLSPEHILRPMGALSGGEQARARLCGLMMHTGNFLVLDEPTNHLDKAARDSLRDALITFTGTVLVVSHDPGFTGGWVNRVLDLGQIRKTRRQTQKYNDSRERTTGMNKITS